MSEDKPKRKRTHGPVCGARTDHGPCGQPAGYGTSHPGVGTCKHHLGNEERHVEHARRLAARQACSAFGIPVKTTASEALAEALDAAHGDWLFYRAQVQKLSAEQMTRGWERITRRQNGTVAEETTVAKSRRNEMVALMMDAQRHYVSLAAECARLGIAEKQLELSGQQTQFMAGRMEALARWLGADVTSEQVRAGLRFIWEHGYEPPPELEAG